MNIVALQYPLGVNLPQKVQFVLNHSFPMVRKLCQKTKTEQFIGGRRGCDHEMLFSWLLVKKITNWNYRTIASMEGVSHPTLIRANTVFLRKKVYEKVFAHLVRKAYKKGLIHGEKLAIDSSFVHTFSKKEEFCSEGWNGFKEAFGFKLHVLIDAETRFPISCCITNGLAADCTLAIPLLKKAKCMVKQTQYVLADKGYDDQGIVHFVNKTFGAKAGIPMRKLAKKGKNYSWEGSTRNFQLKAKGRTLKKSIYSFRTAIERVFAVLKNLSLRTRRNQKISQLCKKLLPDLNLLYPQAL